MQHSDIVVVHEPFTDSYYFSAERRSTRYGRYPDKEMLDHWAVQSDIDRLRTEKVVCVKELAFQALPYVTDVFLASGRHLFLLNEPNTVYSSLVNLKSDFTEEEFGFTSLLVLYERVLRLQVEAPFLFTTQMLQSDPEAILRRICEMAELPFSRTMLNWQPGPIRPWLPHETESQSKWHRTTEQSEGFIPCRETRQKVEVPARALPVVAGAWRVFNLLTSADGIRSHDSLAGEHGGSRSRSVADLPPLAGSRR